MIIRCTKAVMVLCLALLAFLVAFNNLTDLAANRPFVEHVLSMDTTFREPSVTWRAIRAPWAWLAAYGLIIAGEVLTFLAMAAAALHLLAARGGTAAEFNRAKRFLHLATLVAFLVWFAGFMAIGGEWFLMWQSMTWNGQQSAFRFYVTAVLVLIYVNQPDEDLALRDRM